MELYLRGEPNPRQREFLLSRTRHTAYGGARGGGKSWAMRRKLVMLCLAHDGLNCLLMRRTLPELRENHVIPLLHELGGIVEYNSTERVFLFPNNSRLMLGYCDAPNDIYRYQGREYEVIGLEEATHFTFQGFLAKTNYENPPTDEQIAAKCPAKCMSVDPHFETGH